uniref:Uncharacterized protein n=1 Tax=Anguilla anguilla TaxID=7936 RepID=A0A0E9V7B7_ANGAN
MQLPCSYCTQFIQCLCFSQNSKICQWRYLHHVLCLSFP